MIPPIGPPGRLFSRRAVTMRRTAPWTGAVHFTEAVLLHRLSILTLLAALGCATINLEAPGARIEDNRASGDGGGLHASAGAATRCTRGARVRKGRISLPTSGCDTSDPP